MQDKRAKNAHMKAERAAAELHRGGYVMLRLNNGEAALFRGAEFADADDIQDLSRLAGSGPLLVLTANRVKSLGRSLRTNWPAATIAISNQQFDRVFEFMFGHTHIAYDDEINLVAERAGSLADHATRLLRNSKLLPAAILARLPFRDIAVQDRFAMEHNILILEARDLEAYQNPDKTITRIAARAKVPLAVAEDAEIVMFRAEIGNEDHFAVLIGTGANVEAPIVRLHSQCITGDVLGSLKCDCGEQLQTAMRMMTNEGGGVLIYLAQEGRDIGLLNKMRAYALQDKGLDTVDANHMLGFATDERVFLPAARILNALGVTQLRLITNNPDKINQLERYGIKVKERLTMDIASNPYNEGYIDTKKYRTGHMTPNKKEEKKV